MEKEDNVSSSEYTAENIVVKDGDSLEFIYLLVPKWAKKYHKPEEFVHRLLNAGALYGMPIEELEDRYMKKTLPSDKEFAEFYSEYLKEESSI